MFGPKTGTVPHHVGILSFQRGRRFKDAWEERYIGCWCDFFEETRKDKLKGPRHCRWKRRWRSGECMRRRSLTGRSLRLGGLSALGSTVKSARTSFRLYERHNEGEQKESELGHGVPCKVADPFCSLASGITEGIAAWEVFKHERPSYSRHLAMTRRENFYLPTGEELLDGPGPIRKRRSGVNIKQVK